MFNISYLILLLIIFIFVIEQIANKRIKNFLTFLIIIYLVILMGGSLENPDTVIYQNIFERDFFIKDIGFGVLIYALKSIGITFNVFRLTVATIGILLIHHTVNKYVKNTSYFYILYGIYPFMFDIVQVRNFLAMSLFVYAVPFLLELNRKNILKYISIVAIAASMQKIALVYIPLVFVRNIKNKKILKRILMVIIVCSIIVGLSRNVLFKFSDVILTMFSEDLSGLSNYLNINTNWGWIIFWGEQVANFALVYWANKIIFDKIKSGEANKLYSQITVKFSELIYSINLYMFIFLPLFVIDENFTRIIRNVMPLNLMIYCIAGQMLMNNKKLSIKRREKNNETAVLFIPIIILYQVFLLFMLSRSYWDSIVLPVFNNNWIW